MSKQLTEVRKIVTIGNAEGITLPKDWIKEQKLKIGDRILIKAEKV